MIINLIGTEDNYKIKSEKGLGNVTINNEKIKSNTYYGNGTNQIEISGGIGSISINYTR